VDITQKLEMRGKIEIMNEYLDKNVNVLEDVCDYVGVSGASGHCEAEVTGTEGVKLKLVLHDGKKPTYEMPLSDLQWDRLVAWVEWRRKEKALI
jgi:hypothetical protein